MGRHRQRRDLFARWPQLSGSEFGCARCALAGTNLRDECEILSRADEISMSVHFSDPA